MADVRYLFIFGAGVRLLADLVILGYFLLKRDIVCLEPLHTMNITRGASSGVSVCVCAA